MTLDKAISKVAQLDPCQNIQLINFLDKYVSPSGKVWVTSERVRSFIRCRICQSGVAGGNVTVQHIDGRRIEFYPILYHHAEVGHWSWQAADELIPITSEGISQIVSASFDQDLLDIMEDA